MNNTLSTKYQITINYKEEGKYNKEDIKYIEELYDTKLFYCVAYCLEEGEEHTKHMHVFLQYKRRIRFQTVLRRIELSKCYHLEMCRGSCEDNINYIKKQRVYKIFGQYVEIGSNSGKKLILYDKIMECHNYNEVLKIEGIEKYINYAKEVWKVRQEKLNLNNISYYSEITLNPLQSFLFDEIIFKNTDDNIFDRSVYIVSDVKGGSGKTLFCKYLIARNFNVFYTNGGKFNDLAYNYNGEDIVIFDISRSKRFEDINFDFIECVKNGIIRCNKYEGGLKTCPNNVRVLIFTNYEPELFYDKFSLDRLKIIIVDDDHKQAGYSITQPAII